MKSEKLINIEISAGFVQKVLWEVDELVIPAPIGKPEWHIKLVNYPTRRKTNQKSYLIDLGKLCVLNTELIAKPPCVQENCWELDNEAHDAVSYGNSLSIESHIKSSGCQNVVSIGLVGYCGSSLNYKEIDDKVVDKISRWNQNSLIVNIFRIQKAL